MTKKMKSFLFAFVFLTSSCSLGPKIDELDAQAESSDAIATAESEKIMSKVDQNLRSTEQELSQTKVEDESFIQKNSINTTFENARWQLSERDADILKNGDQLILRLKGLNFENNQALISERNIPLLTKVQNVLRTIKSSQIQIEGHTDSLGTKIGNQDLSMKRAEAVQTYLVTNNNMNSGQIVATGLGDTQPIATNKTSSGRALNRRVDIIINSISVE